MSCTTSGLTSRGQHLMGSKSAIFQLETTFLCTVPCWWWITKTQHWSEQEWSGHSAASGKPYVAAGSVYKKQIGKVWTWETEQTVSESLIWDEHTGLGGGGLWGCVHTRITTNNSSAAVLCSYWRMEKVCVRIDVINVQLQLLKRKLGVISCILNMLLLMKQLNLDVLTPRRTRG